MKLPRNTVLLLVPAVVVLLRVASPFTANFSYVVLAAYALVGRAQAIHALGLAWIFSMLNTGLVPAASAATIGRYSVLLAAAVSVALRSGMFTRETSVNRPVLATLFLGALLIAHSLIFSPIVDVSVLKALAWTVSVLTLLAAWSGLSAAEQARTARQVFGGLVVVMLVSVPLLAMPVGYLRNGIGFQGVMNQPQAYGLTIALLGAWAGSRVLADRTPSWTGVALFGGCIVMTLLSGSRTAGIAMVLGIVLAAVAGYWLGGRSTREFMPGLRSRSVHVLIGLGLAAAVLSWTPLAEVSGRFLAKGQGSGSILEALKASRSVLTEPMWLNILAQPWQGIGFGIASDPWAMDIVRDPVTNLPIGASIEKGVMPLAILEEVGIFGFLAVLLWMWVLVRRAARVGGVSALAVFLTVILLNLGESMLFSTGGMGLLCVILIGWSVTARPVSEKKSSHA